ncbi:hypothetical protein VP01_2296g1 [Puccinia sorghi]|uniref:Uncharacterized protein n=1 Tax=Puccinia sorghi TaxID=27349 RepID=A0A0L6V9V2_9BASI|nr:hypothetical protein VP01_2296g1 [Puccinia sorghi]
MANATPSASASDPSTHAALKLSGIEQLSAPGKDSNYLDWIFILKIHLQATNLSYLWISSLDRPAGPRIALLPVWLSPELFIPPTTGSSDSTSGGRMYWLHKLVKSKMSGEDAESHITEMGGYAEKLNSLITVDNPLTADNVYSAALLISLPADWINCVSSLMNDERVPSTQISPLPSPCQMPSQNWFCNNRNNQAFSPSAKDQDMISSTATMLPRGSSSAKSKAPAKAGHTTVVKLGDYTPDKDSFSKFSKGYEESIRTVNVSLAGNPLPHKTKDFNLNSGCSLLMTPYSSTLTIQWSSPLMPELSSFHWQYPQLSNPLSSPVFTSHLFPLMQSLPGTWA